MKLRVKANLRKATPVEFSREYEVETGSYERDEDSGDLYEIKLDLQFTAFQEADGKWYADVEGGYHSDYDFGSIVEEYKGTFAQDLQEAFPGAVIVWA
jgi:hypothetical protein